MNKTLKLGIIIGSAIIFLISLVLVALNFTNPIAKLGDKSVGFQTKAQITDTISETITATPVEVNVNGDIEKTTLGELGVQLTAPELEKLSDEVFNSQALWKVSSWSTPATVTTNTEIDAEKLNSYIETINLAPTVPASVTFDNQTYTVTPAEIGYTIDKNELIEKTKTPFTSSGLQFTVVEQAPIVTDEEATVFAEKLNTLTSETKFKAGEETVAPSIGQPLFTVSEPGEKLSYSVNEETVKAIAEQAPGLVDREGVANENIVDSKNNILFTTFKGTSTRELQDSVADVEIALTENLTNGEAVTELNVEESQPQDVNTFRRIEVDLTKQTTTLYENEQVVNTYAISSGLPGSPTNPGDFTVRAFVREQSMGCGPTSTYCTPNVPWVVYFDGDIAFHGTYWHNNFGTRMSHGCVNLPIDQAKAIYEFAYLGTEVKVLP